MRKYRIGRKRRRRFRRQFKFYIFLLLFIALVYGAYYSVAESGVFNVTQIKIVGELKHFTREGIISETRAALANSRTAKFLGPENVFTWDPQLKLDDPFLKKFELDRSIFSRKIIINIEEREPFGIWCFEGGADRLRQCYWFDRDGIALGSAPQTAGALIIQINDTEPVQPKLGRRVVAEDFFRVVSGILDILRRQPIRFSSYTLNRSRQELTAQTETGTRIVFSLRFDPSDQILTFLNSLISSGQLDKLRYVDLTVKNRIYTKPH